MTTQAAADPAAPEVAPQSSPAPVLEAPTPAAALAEATGATHGLPNPGAALLEEGKRRRRDGIILTGVGGLGLVTGAILLVHGHTPDHACPPDDEDGNCAMGELAAGVAHMVLALTIAGFGTVVAGVGAYWWGSGDRMIRRAHELGVAAVGPFVTPVSGGAVAGLRVVAF